MDSPTTIIEDEPNFLAEFVKEAWAARRFLLAAVGIGSALGCILAYSLPNSYTSKIEVRSEPFQNYGVIFQAIRSQAIQIVDEQQEIDSVFKIIENAIANSIFDVAVFEKAYEQLDRLKTGKQPWDSYNKIVQYRDLTAQRGNEKSFVPGYSVEVTLPSHDEAKEFASAYGNEIRKSANSYVLDRILSRLKYMTELNRLSLDIEKYKFEINSQLVVSDIENGISTSKISGIAKPIIPTDVTISSQIPLIAAVPRYFFGYEILEQEKKIAEDNARNENRVPNYADLVGQEKRLKSLSEIFIQSDVNFVDLRIIPSVNNNSGKIFRFLVFFAFVLLTSIVSIVYIFIINSIRRLNSSKE